MTSRSGSVQIERRITWGNVVSWILVMLTAAIGFGALRGAVQQNARDIVDVRSSVAIVDTRAKDESRLRDEKITAMAISMARIEERVLHISRSVDELNENSKKK